MGFFSWLTILFVALKLLGIITWSWWLVLLPLYWVVALIVIGIAGLFGGAAAIDLSRSLKRNLFD